jgi:hypothetical protein
MKQWTNDDMILLYYQELDDEQSQQLSDAIKASDLLQARYREVCGLLDSVGKDNVPPPSSDLNQRIMANVAELKQTRHALDLDNTKAKSGLSLWSRARAKLAQLFPSDQWGGLATASAVIAVTISVVFYMGRLSVEPVTMATNTSPALRFVDQPAFDEKASRRILLTNVSSHLETSGRFLTLVSNSGKDSEIDMASRAQMLQDMIGFNRLYRRAAERSNDLPLVSVLQQMEIVLLQLSHTDDDTNESDLDGIRSRLDDSDLLFKLKVTNKKINRELI